MIGSSLDFSRARVQEGVTRRSLEVLGAEVVEDDEDKDEEAVEVMMRGMSRLVMGTEFMIGWVRRSTAIPRQVCFTYDVPGS